MTCLVGTKRDVVLHRSSLAAQAFDQRNEFGIKAQHARSGVVQDIGEFLGAQPDIERQQDRADLRHAVVGLEQAVTIKAQVGHAVGRLQAQLQQGIG